MYTGFIYRPSSLYPALLILSVGTTAIQTLVKARSFYLNLLVGKIGAASRTRLHLNLPSARDERLASIETKVSGFVVPLFPNYHTNWRTELRFISRELSRRTFINEHSILEISILVYISEREPLTTRRARAVCEKSLCRYEMTFQYRLTMASIISSYSNNFRGAGVSATTIGSRTFFFNFRFRILNNVRAWNVRWIRAIWLELFFVWICFDCHGIDSVRLQTSNASCGNFYLFRIFFFSFFFPFNFSKRWIQENE